MTIFALKKSIEAESHLRLSSGGRFPFPVPGGLRGSKGCGVAGEAPDSVRIDAMRKAILPIFLLVVLGAVYLMWDSDPPEISLQTPVEVGTESAIILGIEDRGRGLESVRVVIRQGDYTRQLFEKVNPVSWLPWKQGESSVQVELGPDDWLDRQQLKEGTFTLEVSAGDAGDYGFFSDSVVQNLEMNLRLNDVVFYG